MAGEVSSIRNARLKYPLSLISSSLLLLFILPVFQVFVYFVPLLLSTGLCVAALVTLGPSFRDGESLPPPKDEKSWLGRLRLVQERARAWIESKLRISDSSSEELPDSIEEECPDTANVKTEHEKRVRQLERTLRSLSFVSYEGIFASDGSIIEENTDDDSKEPEEETASGAGEDEPHPRITEHRNDDASAARDESRSQEENMSEDSISWQRVEHNDAENSSN